MILGRSPPSRGTRPASVQSRKTRLATHRRGVHYDHQASEASGTLRPPRSAPRHHAGVAAGHTRRSARHLDSSAGRAPLRPQTHRGATLHQRGSSPRVGRVRPHTSAVLQRGEAHNGRRGGAARGEGEGDRAGAAMTMSPGRILGLAAHAKLMEDMRSVPCILYEAGIR